MRALAAFFVLALASQAFGQEAPLRTFNTRIILEYAQPAAKKFVDATGQLADTLAPVCAGSDEIARTAVREAFAATVKAWGRLSILRLPPLEEQNRAERILFHPDPRGVTGRQLNRLLAEKDESALANVAEKSIALKGLGTLDLLMTRLDGDYACRLAGAIADEIHATAEEIESAFRGAYADAALAPSSANPLYRNDAEVSEDIVNALATSMAALRDLVLAPTLGESPSKARWKQAPLQRSGLSLHFVRQQIEGMAAVLEAGQVEAILPADIRWPADSIRFELNNILRLLDGINGSLESIVTNNNDRSRLNAALISLAALEPLIKDDLAEALGLKLGFNALDGD